MAKKDADHLGSDIRAGLLSSSTHLPPPAQRMGIDDMLRLHVGEFGRWQLGHFVLTCAAWALEAFHTMVMIFADRQPAWRCLSDVDCPPEPCGIPSSAWEWVDGTAASTVSEWGLICGQRYKVGLAQSAFFAGCMLGLFWLYAGHGYMQAKNLFMQAKFNIYRPDLQSRRRLSNTSILSSGGLNSNHARSPARAFEWSSDRRRASGGAATPPTFGTSQARAGSRSSIPSSDMLPATSLVFILQADALPPSARPLHHRVLSPRSGEAMAEAYRDCACCPRSVPDPYWGRTTPPRQEGPDGSGHADAR